MVVDQVPLFFSAGAPGSVLSSPNAAQINYDAVAHDDYLVTPSINVTAEIQVSELKTGLYIVNLHMEDGSVKSIKAIKK